jgi:hypothetical protein
VVYIGWISLFVVQATLVARNRTDLHRQLGAVGVVWGVRCADARRLTNV